MRIVCALVVFCLLPGTALAQRGLRSASLPENNLTSSIQPARPDLFLAGPDTYSPRPYPFLFVYPIVMPWPPYVPLAGTVPSPPTAQIAAPAFGTAPRAVSTSPVNPPVPIADVPPAPTRGGPKLFYVIPACYAGDKPPEADRLPSGCDITKLRTIAPTG